MFDFDSGGWSPIDASMGVKRGQNPFVAAQP